MINFIQPKIKKEKADKAKVEIFINAFNNAIKKNKFVLNNGLNKIPTLSDADFELAKKQANKNGYVLTQ